MPALASTLTVGAAAMFAACGGTERANQAPTTDAMVSVDSDGGPGGTPIDGISPQWQSAFITGQAAFAQVFSEQDGLGPLYTKTSCAGCHADGTRGPGDATKMAVVGSDDLTPLADQSLLPYGDTVHPLFVADIPGVHTPILPPFDGGIDGGGYDDAGLVYVRVTNRVGPPVYGRGYMEAVLDSEILRMETSQSTRTDGIHGHANRVQFISSPNPDSTFDSTQTGQTVIGRFGLKARIATLDEFAADALQGDMGITSPMRPTEFKNPDNVLDDLKPGIDTTSDQMNAPAMYPRLLAIPARGDLIEGKVWFESCHCDVCHAESLKTRSDYPIAQLANIDAPIYSDMLLHDMGDNLSDSVAGGNEGQAGPRDWRTAPLMGVRFSTTYLHDGRSSTIDDAILQHASPGSEASNAVTCYEALGDEFKTSVINFVGTL